MFRDLLSHTVRIYEAGRPVSAVLSSLGLGEREVHAALTAGRVRLNRRVAKRTDDVESGDLLVVVPEGATVAGVEPLEIPLRIVHEDPDLVVLDKPPYLLVHPARADQRHTLIHGLAHHYRSSGVESRLHLVHRLDRDTSGLVVLAKTPAAHTRLAEQLESREMRREYLGWVWGRVPREADRIVAPIAVDPAHPILRVVRPDGEYAATRYEVLERFAAATRLRLVLETGRTHQIRVHLSHLGHPLLGDRQYARRGLRWVGRQALHAERLTLRHPCTGRMLTFTAPVPNDLLALEERLRTAGD